VEAFLNLAIRFITSIFPLGFLIEISRPHYFISPKASSNMILTFHQCDGLGGVVEDADLIISTDQPAVLNADESDELPTLIETFKKFQYVSGEHGFIGGVGYAALLGVGIEVGVAEFYGDTRSQSVFAP